MVLSATASEAVVCLSAEELRAHRLSPQRLTREQALRLVRAALAREGLSTGEALALQVFPSNREILIFVSLRPALCPVPLRQPAGLLS